MNQLVIFLITSMFLSCTPSTKVNADSEQASEISGENKEVQPVPRAFVTVTSPGTQMIGEDGQPVSQFMVEHTIYLQFKSGIKPVITTIRFDGAELTPAFEKIDQSTLSVGKTFDSNTDIYIDRVSGLTLWKLSCSTVTQDANIAGPAKKIFLKGTAGAQNFTYNLSNEIQLQPQMMY